MTEREFVQWLRGFTQGVHHYSLSPKQWDYLKGKLKEVKTGTSEYVLTDTWTTNIG